MRRFICRLTALASRGAIGDVRGSKSFLKVFALTLLLIYGAMPGVAQSSTPSGPLNYQTPLSALGLSGNSGKVAKGPGSPRASQTNFSVAGTWHDSLGNIWTLTQDKSGNVSGSVSLEPIGSCPCGPGMCGGSGHSLTWTVSGADSGPNFTLNAYNPATGDICASAVNANLTIASDGMTANGSYSYGVGGGSLFMTLTLTCATILNGGQLLVDGDTLADLISGVPTINQNGVTPMIIATFTPGVNGGDIPMSQAYQLCGFTHFDWTQTVNFLPDPSPFEQNSAAGPVPLTSTSTPFPDPPKGTGQLTITRRSGRKWQDFENGPASNVLI